MKNITCGAKCKTTGQPCKAQATQKGRCRLHGGMSTGPKTGFGLNALRLAAKKRFHAGHSQALAIGYSLWLEKGGRRLLQENAKKQSKLKSLD